MTQPGANHHDSFRRGARVFTWVVTIGFLYVIRPLLLPVAMGAVFAVLFLPLLKRLERRKVSTGLGSALITLGVALLVLLPISAILATLARAGIEQIQQLRASGSLEAPVDAAGSADVWGAILRNPRLAALFDRVTEWIPVPKDQLLESASDVVRGVGARAAEFMAGLASQIPGMALALVMIVVSLYFFLVDGRRLVEFVRRSSVLNPE